MATHYVLVDFENIQPEATDLSFLNDERIKIIIFVNSNQKLPVDMVKKLQPIGARVDYIKMPGSGKNSLDFLIAFYIGDILHNDHEANIYVISNDTGFDPLIKYLTATRSSSVKRFGAVMSVSKHIAASTHLPEASASPGIVKRRVINICTALQSLSINNWPDSTSALENFIKSTLNDCDLPEQHITGLLKFMTRKDLISIDPDGVLKYQSENIAAGATGTFISKDPANGFIPNPTPTPSIKELAKKACDNLKARGNSKPRTLKTLTSTLKSVFNGGLSDQRIASVLDFMRSKKIIAVSEGTKVTYDFGKEESTK
jgi:hypothetical protein